MQNLAQLRANLRNNLWNLVNEKPLVSFQFMEYLVGILIPRAVISTVPIKLLKKYSEKLKDQYSQVLDYLEINILNGDIIELEHYIKQNINGNITTLLEAFVNEFESLQKHNN